MPMEDGYVVGLDNGGTANNATVRTVFLVGPDKRPKKKENGYNIANIFSTTLRDTGEVALVDGDTEKISGNKVKRLVTVRTGVDQETAKKIVKLLKESKVKVQGSIQVPGHSFGAY